MRADEFVSGLDQFTVRLLREHHLRDSGHYQRIDDSKQHRCCQREPNRDQKILFHVRLMPPCPPERRSSVSFASPFEPSRAAHANPTCVMIKSMILIPMNGAMTPPN